MTNVGLCIAELRDLSERLEANFDSASFGHAQFVDLGERERAVIADETCRSIQAICENLMELALHEHDLAALVGTGLPHVGTGSPPEDYINMTRVDLNITGYFRAFGSSLDCLAAAAIAILRAPRNMQLATYSNLFNLNDPRATVDPEQRREWERFVGLMERHRRRSPHGWLDWAMATRNAVVHRARHLSVLSQVARPRSPLIVITDDPVAVLLTTSRFLPHLRRRPWLRDVDDLVENGSDARSIWLEEAAGVTLAGLTRALNVLLEEAASLLHDAWFRAGNGRVNLRFPGELRAQRTQAPIIVFDGFEPGSQPFPPGSILSGPFEVERMQIVNRLRAQLSRT